MQWESLAALWILLALKVPNAFQQQPKSRIPTSIMLNMIILMNKVSSSFVAVVVFLELVLNFINIYFRAATMTEFFLPLAFFRPSFTGFNEIIKLKFLIILRTSFN